MSGCLLEQPSCFAKARALSISSVPFFADSGCALSLAATIPASRFFSLSAVARAAWPSRSMRIWLASSRSGFLNFGPKMDMAASISRLMACADAPLCDSFNAVLAHAAHAARAVDSNSFTVACCDGSPKLATKAPKSLLSASIGSPGEWTLALRNAPMATISGGISPASSTSSLTIWSFLACAALNFRSRSSTSSTSPIFRRTTACVRRAMTRVGWRAPPRSCTGSVIASIVPSIDWSMS
mmetsp:Transcript_44257/g.114421  ORF Transcript_44257/g.114421 Transcript_44257/m.114421 type:complete len:240 (+) Transcript_44257:362-1081(+)